MKRLINTIQALKELGVPREDIADSLEFDTEDSIPTLDDLALAIIMVFD